MASTRSAPVELVDEAALQFWNVSICKPKIPNHQLTAALRQRFEVEQKQSYGLVLELIVDFVIDSQSEGWLTPGHLQSFINRFGPFRECVANCAGSLFDEYSMEMHPWYCGRMPKSTAQTLLSSRRRGSFLIRMSGTSPNGFALEYVSMRSPKATRRVRVFRVPTGYTCPTLNDMRVFYTLNELVQENSSRLVYPVISDMAGVIKKKIQLLKRYTGTPQPRTSNFMVRHPIPPPKTTAHARQGSYHNPYFGPPDYDNVSDLKQRAAVPRQPPQLHSAMSAEPTRSLGMPAKAPAIRRGLSTADWENLGEMGRDAMRTIYSGVRTQQRI